MSEASPTILIVDDDATLAESLAMVLSMKGYRATYVETGEAGVEQFVDDMPDLVVMDGQLPGMDGAEAIRAMRDLGYQAGVIAISAEDRESEMILAGADIFLPKPIEMPTFLGGVERLLAEWNGS